MTRVVTVRLKRTQPQPQIPQRAQAVLDGYDPTQFAGLRRSIGSFEGACYNAIALFLLKHDNGGGLPLGAKTSYAKKILLHHPDLSLKTARNLVSTAWKVQAHYSSLIRVHFGGNRGRAESFQAAEASVAKLLAQGLEAGSHARNIDGINEFLISLDGLRAGIRKT